jgi:hypothetical protein
LYWKQAPSFRLILHWKRLTLDREVVSSDGKKWARLVKGADRWRNIAIARFDLKKGEQQTAHACDIIFDSGVREMCGNAVQNQPKPAENSDAKCNVF